MLQNTSVLIPKNFGEVSCVDNNMIAYLRLTFFLIGTGLLLSPSICFGAMFVDCLFKAEVLKIYSESISKSNKAKVRIRILSGAKTMFPSQIGCSNFRPDEKDIELQIPDGMSDLVSVGKQISVHHHYSNGKTSAGVYVQDFWELQ